MSECDKGNWPILIVSNLFLDKRDEGLRLARLEKYLRQICDCEIIECQSFDDARDTFLSQSDLGAIVIDWDMPKVSDEISPTNLLKSIRERNVDIPVFLLTEKVRAENLDSESLNQLTGTLWKMSDTIEFLGGNIKKHFDEYIDSLYSPFFGALVKYARQCKYAWHTPGHMGGTGFLRTPSGTAFFKYIGENALRTDLSISVPELGTLLDHTGITGDAERNSARVFGADMTYYVLNGTSNVNQIIWRSQVSAGDIVFVDSNCHKSLNYAMVITDSVPVYMNARRNKMGIIGPIMLKEFAPQAIAAKIAASRLIPAGDKNRKIKIAALTNSTYDGVCYNITKIKDALSVSVENLHFDEAWFAYAKFFPIYKNFYALTEDKIKPEHPPIFVSHSTHKLLTALSQSSMLHIRNGGTVKINPSEFNESYMMHSSTSPQYNMVASLDVATQMMDEAGESV